jgi:hypothetical protein
MDLEFLSLPSLRSDSSALMMLPLSSHVSIPALHHLLEAKRACLLSGHLVAGAFTIFAIHCNERPWHKVLDPKK